MTIERGMFARDEHRFCPISLGDWLETCEEADVPHISAKLICEIERDDWLKFDINGPHLPRLMNAIRQVYQFREWALDEEEPQPPLMIRPDHCAMDGVKANLGIGKYQWSPEMLEFDIGSAVRAFDILNDWPRPTIEIWSRPWVAPVIIQDYPVEYRAFVEKGEIAGISSYYPQRPLPQMDGDLDLVYEYTGRLIDQLEDDAPFQWQRNLPLTFSIEDIEYRKSVSFTADFLVQGYGDETEVLFLEGNPPHRYGAHPCCFKPGQIEGLALSLDEDEA